MNPAKRNFVFPSAISFAFFALLFVLSLHRPAASALIAEALTPAAPLPPSIALTPPETEVNLEDTLPTRSSEPRPQIPEPPAVLAPTGISIVTTSILPSIVRPGIVTITPSGNFGPGLGDRPGNGLTTAAMLDAIPRALAQASPNYPYSAKEAGRSGQVTVEFWVDTKGAVHDPRAVNSTAYEFDEAAVHAVGRWRFEPGRQHGRIVPFHMAVPVKFSIEP
jgi:periplasmic protein TonB